MLAALQKKKAGPHYDNADRPDCDRHLACKSLIPPAIGRNAIAKKKPGIIPIPGFVVRERYLSGIRLLAEWRTQQSRGCLQPVQAPMSRRPRQSEDSGRTTPRPSCNSGFGVASTWETFSWHRPLLKLVVVDGLHLIGDHLGTTGKSRMRVGTNIGVDDGNGRRRVGHSLELINA